jgi:hypothetical protein
MPPASGPIGDCNATEKPPVEILLRDSQGISSSIDWGSYAEKAE